LKIRLQYDSITQSEFFRALVTGYLGKDPRILDYLYEWREINKTYSKTKRAKSESLLRKGKALEEKFGLSDGELESIFDLIEESHPDL